MKVLGRRGSPIRIDAPPPDADVECAANRLAQAAGQRIDCLAVVRAQDGRWYVRRYTAKPRQRDGVWTWRAVQTYPPTYNDEQFAGARVRELSADLGLPYRIGVSHGRPVHTTLTVGSPAWTQHVGDDWK